MQLLEAYKIWDKAPHNAFTDLIWFKGYFYCAFREGSTHMSYDGKLRIIRSSDAKTWESVALMKYKNGDVRDAKLSITPSNELMPMVVCDMKSPLRDTLYSLLRGFQMMAENGLKLLRHCLI